MYNWMDFAEKQQIEDALNANENLPTIAAKLGRGCWTVSSEIKRHRLTEEVMQKVTDVARSHPYPVFDLWYLLDGLTYRSTEAAVEAADCKRLSRFPHCCNGCPEASSCTRPRIYYSCTFATQWQNQNVCAAHSDFRKNHNKVDQIMETVRQERAQGRNLAQIYQLHGERDFQIPKSSFYSLVSSVENMEQYTNWTRSQDYILAAGPHDEG